MVRLRVGAVSRNYFNMPLWIGRHAGLFAAEGLDVELHLIEAIGEVSDRLAAGDLDVALSVTENVVLDNERGGSLRIVAGNVNRLPFSLIGRPEIRTIADLKGRVIGASSVDAGSSSLIMRLLAAHGLAAGRDYEIRAVGPILARSELLQSGGIDAGLQGAPLDAVALERGFVALANPRVMFPDFQFTSCNVEAGWAAGNPDALVAFLRAWLGAHDWFYANREGSADVCVAETGIARRHALGAWDEYTREAIFPPDGAASAAAIDTLIDVSGAIRRLERRRGTRAADYRDDRWLAAARASLGRAPA